MKKNKFDVINSLLLLIGVVVSGFFVLKAEASSTLAMISFLFLLIFPYLILYALNRRGVFKEKEVYALVITLVVEILGFYALVDAFYFSPDPQGGIILLILPVFQIVEIIVLLLILKLFRKREEKKS
jgi:cellulose synthase/poly-beta-1,6-N-acetylglucosamine synthase-like glycosyltransferase